jgi:membrane-associated phospholipid phosphatase
VWMVAGIFILVIGFSRIYLGVHYPSDVLGGYVVGVFCLALVRAVGLLAALPLVRTPPG